MAFFTPWWLILILLTFVSLAIARKECQQLPLGDALAYAPTGDKLNGGSIAAGGNVTTTRTAA